jgi:hypothetical protein
MKSMSSFRLRRYSTTAIAIRLLVVLSTISSLLLVSFHYKSGLLQQTYDQEQNNHRFGPPPTVSTKSTDNKLSKPWNKTKIASVSTPMEHRLENKATFTTTTNGTFAASKETTDLLHTESDRGCFSHLNSLSWLEDKRFGNQNSHDSRSIDDDYIASSILNITSLFSDLEANSQNILRHTMCARSSRFLNLKFSSFRKDDGNEQLHHDSDGDENFLKTGAAITTNNQQTIHHLSLRLLYLSVHVHQHMHAMKEARHRLANPGKCEQERKARNIGKFDFECPDAKFLVVPLKHSGLGGQVRLITAPVLMVGIASDRVILFVNNSPVGPNYLREPWDLSSCPRRDKQCFFLPDSPCVLTHNEIQNATELGKGERRALFKTGRLPDHMENERVIVMNMKDRPQRTPLNFRNKIAHFARQFLIDPLARENPGDPRLPLLSAAADHILQEDESIDDLFYYHGRNFQAHHAMVFFSMRPKVEFAERIDRIVDSTLGDNHRTDLALGLPIRASDKCVDESECPSFETYMLLMQNVRDTNEKYLADAHSKDIPNSSNTENSTAYTTNIILTSESSDVLQAQRAFQEKSSSHHKNHTFPFKFVTNAFDVLQNTGNPSKMMSTSESSKEEIILSSLASLKLQFYAKYSVGNCCSNHHLLLFDFLTEGCGASESDHVANCMQDHQDERFRICCGWTKTEECLSRRSQWQTL